MNADAPLLLPLLKQYFGFSSFRPLQEEIIRDVLMGRDVLALLPTGGGKSLCFQLPAMARSGLTVVVSPLISLMKDQVDALQASGVPATFLNSTLEAHEARSRFRGLHNAEYRLLYVAPERLMLSGTLDALKKWQVRLLAIDEAHCISEWGHDFRPEYRQLAQLRDHFSDVPLLALTATATERVREDIGRQLHLREPRRYVASFNRPNLHYRVEAKVKAYEQLFEFLQARANESGIVYCQSRKSADSLAARLSEDGVKAKPYHAGLSVQERTAHQDLFLRDDVRVVCATIAFGMGINKPNVRYVVHYDLPKNIEGYYQETGRAGRDGLPSECLLLFSAGDVVKYFRFIEAKPDPNEKQIAREQLQQMVQYAESSQCRRVSLLGYFGEKFGEGRCDACDNCLSPRDTYDGTVVAQKFLSCVYRIRERSNFSVGLNHVVEVLTGADTDKIRKWGHQTLSTFGIGHEYSRTQWSAIGRELVRLGYVKQLPEKFNVLELTPAGRDVLKQRGPVTLTKPVTAPEPATQRTGDIACDATLLERLMALRKRLADERAVPPYIIFSDVALRQMARFYPSNEGEFLRISGVGQKKLQELGAFFLSEINEHLRSHPRQIFADDSFEGPGRASGPPRDARASLSDTVWDTVKRFRSGASIEQIATVRQFAASTVYKHLLTAIDAGEAVALDRFLSDDQQRQVAAAFAQIGFGNLTGVHELLGGRIDFDRLRLYRALAQSRGGA
jgi:ATP-dependent DNA helicase RecQ